MPDGRLSRLQWLHGVRSRRHERAGHADAGDHAGEYAAGSSARDQAHAGGDGARSAHATCRFGGYPVATGECGFGLHRARLGRMRLRRCDRLGRGFARSTPEPRHWRHTSRSRTQLDRGGAGGRNGQLRARCLRNGFSPSPDRRRSATSPSCGCDWRWSGSDEGECRSTPWRSALGYRSHAAFSRAFKRVTGQPPGAMRSSGSHYLM